MNTRKQSKNPCHLYLVNNNLFPYYLLGKPYLILQISPFPHTQNFKVYQT